MTTLDEETALSLLFGNTKRKKRSTDLVTLAEACAYLVRLRGSQRAVAESLGLSTEMIREFLMALKLPDEVREMIRQRKIDRLDVVRELASLKSQAAQVEAARVAALCSSKDLRDIKRLIKLGGTSVEEARALVLGSKPKGFHIFLLDLDDELYSALLESSEKMGMKPAEVARQVLAEWIARRPDKGSKSED